MVRHLRQARSRVSWTRSSAASRFPVRTRAPRNSAADRATTKPWKSFSDSEWMPTPATGPLPARGGCTRCGHRARLPDPHSPPFLSPLLDGKAVYVLHGHGETWVTPPGRREGRVRRGRSCRAAGRSRSTRSRARRRASGRARCRPAARGAQRPRCGRDRFGAGVADVDTQQAGTQGEAEFEVPPRNRPWVAAFAASSATISAAACPASDSGATPQRPNCATAISRARAPRAGSRRTARRVRRTHPP